MKAYRDFPSSSVVKTPCFHCRGHRFYFWLRTKIPHAVWHGQKKKKKIISKRNAIKWSILKILEIIINYCVHRGKWNKILYNIFFRLFCNNNLSCLNQSVDFCISSITYFQGYIMHKMTKTRTKLDKTRTNN